MVPPGYVYGEWGKSLETSFYGYALTLVDTFFTREEQNQCLMFKSKKSDKPGLDPAREEVSFLTLNSANGTLAYLHTHTVLNVCVYMCTCTQSSIYIQLVSTKSMLTQNGI